MNEVSLHYKYLGRVAWAAGLIEGEGWIGWIGGSWGKPTQSVKVVNTEGELLERLVSIFEVGSIRPRKRYNENHKQAWVWSVYGKNARKVLRIIQPHLYSPHKRAQVQALLKVEHPC